MQCGAGPKMIQDDFVIEEADDKTILVRHLIAGVRFLFVIKGRKYSDLPENRCTRCARFAFCFRTFLAWYVLVN